MTPWDLQFLRLDTIQKGLLFHKPKQENTNTSKSSLVDRLKESLSRTLHFFPPLAGRFSTIENTDDDTVSFFINCNNAGVEFTHASAPKLTVSAILDSTRVPLIVHHLFPLNNIRNIECVTKPLFGVQITELVDGFFIGCTMSHGLGDGTCFWHFFNSWSEISRGCQIISKIPVFERYFSEEMKTPIHLPLKLDDEKLFEKFEVPPLMERIFHLSKESICKLKDKANSEMDVKSISSLQAFLAHLWRSITRCRKLDDEKEVVISIIIVSDNASFDVGGGGGGDDDIVVAMDIIIRREVIDVVVTDSARTRLNPPLPEGYFGNAVHIKQVKITAGELLKNRLGWAAMQMNKMVVSQNSEEVMKFYKEWAENPLIFCKGSVLVGNTRLGISSSPRYNIYGADFGWGKPVAVRSGMANKSDGKITLFPGVEEGSVDIEVCILPETLQALESDQEFMEAITKN
ncbi:putative histone-lysine N-methyltransferase EZA1-like [Capsicum annuum]|nr:putative histone-lysine N-methyltransferase EZA1-like [Capsicum annuum]